MLFALLAALVQILADGGFVRGICIFCGHLGDHALYCDMVFFDPIPAEKKGTQVPSVT